MAKAKIVQQGTNLGAIGGLTSEFNSLKKTSLNEKYEMLPMVLPTVHRSINYKDIKFYYDYLSKTKPDIVQIRGAQIDGLNAQIAAKLVPGVKILVCIHGMFSELVYLSPIKKFIHTNVVEPLIFYMCDGISCVYQKGNDRKQLKHFKNKLLPFVYNRLPSNISITEEEKRKIRNVYDIPEDAVLGIFCGRFTREKGLGYLLEAFRQMTDEWPDNFQALMVGDGEFLDYFKKQIVYLGISSYVHCIGAKDNVKPFLAMSDFFIMPSLHENHSIALLEALAAALPCVATDVGGNAEIIHQGIEGILCDPFDSQQLKESIVSMVTNKALREKYKNNIIHGDYSQFSNEAVDKQLDDIYQILLNKKTHQ